MVDTYDFSKHDAEHYAKYEYSYGIVLINPEHDKVLLVKTPQGFYGFAKGHKNDGEESAEAAAREIKEELGVDIKPEDFLTFWKEEEQIRSLSVKYQHELSKEHLDKHIAKQQDKGERPYWHKPGESTRKIVFYVAELDPDTPLEIDDELAGAEWVTMSEAMEKIKSSGSNHDVILERLMELLKIKQGGCPCQDKIQGSYETPFIAVFVMALIIAIIIILMVYVTRIFYMREACCI
jgi:8-oxo-dGTP pyrophosphatase MutT (NUDIX family)